jgi:cytochrome b
MKTYVWTIPMRIFHWLFVLGLVAAYILGEDDDLLKLHVAFGYTVGILVIYRFIYGFVGAKYSRFSAFPVRIGSLREYAFNIKKLKGTYVGHNPFSALVMLLIFIDVVLAVITGIMSLASMNQGILKSLVVHDSEAFKELHEVFANILIPLVIIHLLGLIIDRFQNKESGTIQSIFTGYKNVEGTNVKESRWHNLGVFVVISLLILAFTMTMKSDIVNTDDEDQIHYEDDAH